MCVMRTLMHLSLDHVTLLQGKFQPPKLFSDRTYDTGRPRVGLCLIFLVLFMFCSSFFQRERIAAKFCSMHDLKHVGFHNPGPKIWGPVPPKKKK